MQGLGTRNKQIPTVVRAILQQVWLSDLGIELIDRTLHSMMSRFMEESDLVHLGCDAWEIVETSIVLRGRFILLLLRIEIHCGWVDIDIMEMPR